MLLVSPSVAAEPPTLARQFAAKSILILKDVAVWPHLGIAGDKRGRIIRETVSSEYRLERMLHYGLPQRFPSKRVEIPCTTTECSRAWNNHYHLLVDALPRVWGLWHERLRAFERIDLYVCELADHAMRPLLERMLPPNVRIVAVPAATRLVAKTYIHLPVLAEDYCGYIPVEALALLRHAVEQVYGAAPVQPRRRILISRSLADKRRITNEAELFAALDQHGFELVCLEKLTLAEQVRLFQEAEVVVGPHGAGLTNVIFSNRCRVMELFAGEAWNHYRWLCHSCGHEYGNLTQSATAKNDDFPVPVSEVVELMSAAGWLD
jgi:capsular polysaccharide biosynthesis protein